MRLLSHPPDHDYSSASPRIINDLDLREPLQADGMNLCDPVLEACALDSFRDLAILQGSFQDNELPIPEGLGELRDISPGVVTCPLFLIHS